jgi:hypothetical protein
MSYSYQNNADLGKRGVNGKAVYTHLFVCGFSQIFAARHSRSILLVHLITTYVDEVTFVPAPSRHRRRFPEPGVNKLPGIFWRRSE